MTISLIIVALLVAALVGYRLIGLRAALARRPALRLVDDLPDPETTPGTHEYAVATWKGPGHLPAPLDPEVMKRFTIVPEIPDAFRK